MKRNHIFLIGVVIIAVGTIFVLGKNKKQTVVENRQTQVPLTSSNGTLTLAPSSFSLHKGEEKEISIVANFVNGSASETINYLKTSINYSPDSIILSEGKYVDTSESGFDKIFRVDGPTAANQTGVLVIELGVKNPGTGPTTDKPVVIGKFAVTGKSQTGSVQEFTFGNTQMVNGNAQVVPMKLEEASYQVNE